MRRRALDAVRAALTPSTSTSASTSGTRQSSRRVRRASSSSSSPPPSTPPPSSSRGEALRAEVREGKRPAFVDVATHVLTQSRAKRTFGWDWHAWHATLACIPAFASYCAVQYIDKTYVPEYEARMKAKSATANSAVDELKTRAEREETKRDAERDTLETRVAALEARVKEAERKAANAIENAKSAPVSSSSAVGGKTQH